MDEFINKNLLDPNFIKSSLSKDSALPDYNKNIDWRWRLESIQPGGPTGANIGTMLQDLRTVWHGGQANAVNNELAQNAAYRKELGDIGNDLIAINDAVRKNELSNANEYYNRNKDELDYLYKTEQLQNQAKSQENLERGHANVANSNLEKAIASEDPYLIENAAEELAKYIGTDEANKRKNELLGKLKTKKEQNTLASNLSAQYFSQFKTKEEQDAAYKNVKKKYEDGEIRPEQYAALAKQIYSKPDEKSEKSKSFNMQLWQNWVSNFINATNASLVGNSGTGTTGGTGGTGVPIAGGF